MSPEQDDRQRIVRVPGQRRAQLSPAPGTIPEPVTGDAVAVARPSWSPREVPAASGPNDDRMRQDVPPHY